MKNFPRKKLPLPIICIFSPHKRDTEVCLLWPQQRAARRWEVNGVWLLLCCHKRLMRCTLAWRHGDNDALYGRGGVVQPRGGRNDTPQISLSALLIGHGHLPCRPHTRADTHARTHTQTQKRRGILYRYTRATLSTRDTHAGLRYRILPGFIQHSATCTHTQHSLQSRPHNEYTHP